MEYVCNKKQATLHSFKPKNPILDLTEKENYLTHCQKCSKPYNQPTTLSCGYNLCLTCTPTDQFQCHSFTCMRTHENEKNKQNILLSNLLDLYNNNQKVEKSLFDCSICYSPLIDPITTSCGHTFCKLCLNHLMQQSKHCPICRYQLSYLGKVNTLLALWYSFLFEPEKPATTNLPIIQLTTSSLLFPSQTSVIHLSGSTRLQALFNSSHRYAICLFSKDSTNSFYEYGTMIKLTHVDISSDISHIVIQALGLFRVKINQLSFDEPNHCYHGDISRLDDREESEIRDRWLPPVTQTPPQSPIHRSRPSSMRLTSPTLKPVEAQLPFTRPSWMSQMSKPIIIPSLLNTFLPPNELEPCTLQLVDEAIDNQLHPILIKFFHRNDHLLPQYHWYLQNRPQSAEALIWWLGLILPLSSNQKIDFFGTHTLYERTRSLISLIHQ
ncbi:hypothetical protein G6F56_005724 [Rhizopus delemar]|nr:hypothetical protein G6F56_005724 [Rhizopus delemar]